MKMISEEQRAADRDLIGVSELPHLARRKLRWLEIPEKLRNSRAQLVGVPKMRKPVFRRDLRVVGTGRCGTSWLAKMLQTAGYAIGHEYVDKQGTVSMFFHTDCEWYPFLPWNKHGRAAHVGERLSDFEFNMTAHIVRHPLECEASMRSNLTLPQMFWAQESGVLSVPYDMRPNSLRLLHYWHDVVRHCESISSLTLPLNRIRTGDRRATKLWRTLLSEARLDSVPFNPMPELPAVNKSSGYKKHEPLDWFDVHAMDAKLALTLKKMTRKLKLED